MQETWQRLEAFLGLRNAAAPLNRPGNSLSEASQDIFIDGAGHVRSRPGFGEAWQTAVTDAFQPAHFEYALIVQDGALLSLWPDNTTQLLVAGLTDTTGYWAQLGQFVAFAGAVDAWIIVDGVKALPLRIPMPPTPTVDTVDGTLPPGQYQFTAHYRHLASGRTGPAVPSVNITLDAPGGFEITVDVPDGYEADVFVASANSTVESYLATTDGAAAVPYGAASVLQEPLPDRHINTYPLPVNVRALAFYAGSLWAAVYNRDTLGRVEDKSLLLWSLPGANGFHLFRRGDNDLSVPGQVLGMAALADGLLVATDKAIMKVALVDAPGPDGPLVLPQLTYLARFGAVPGWPVEPDQDGGAIVWTVRGQCYAAPGAPLANLFADGPAAWKCSVPPGTQVANAIIHHAGQRLAVAFTDGEGAAFNS